MSSRQIHRTSTGSRQHVRELLEAVFTAELLSPSRRLYLVSPWVRDIELIDNRDGGYRGLDSSWGRRVLSLAEVLALLIERGTSVVLATRDNRENQAFEGQIRSRLGAEDARRFHAYYQNTLHSKGLVGDHFALSGSMNFTHNGVENLDELLRYELDMEKVAELQTSFAAEYGGGA